MKKFAKVALFTVAAAIGVSVCSVFAGCGSKNVLPSDVSIALEEYENKLILAESCKLDLNAEVSIKSASSSMYGAIEINLAGSNELKRLKNSRLDLTNHMKVTTSGNITDDIELLVGNSFYFGNFDIKIDDSSEVDVDTVNKIYVRDDTEYVLRDGELISMLSGERRDGDLCQDVVKSYAGAAARIGDWINEDFIDKLLYPYEKHEVNAVGSLYSELQSVSLSAVESDDKLEVTLTAKTFYDADYDSEQLEDMTNKELDEFFGHLRNRDFSANLKISLTMDASPSLKKGKFDKVDVEALTQDVLCFDYGNAWTLKDDIQSGTRTQINLIGNGDEMYNDLVYSNGSYTRKNLQTCSANMQFYAYLEDNHNDRTRYTTYSFSKDDYDVSNKKFIVYSMALSMSKNDMLDNYNYDSYTDKKVNYYTATVKSVTITLTYKSLREDAEVNEYGYYDSDQYRNFTHKINLYYQHS